MKKSELITTVHKLYPFLKAGQVMNVVDLVFTNLINGFAQGDRAEIRGFGSFTPRERKVQLNFPTQTDTITTGKRNGIYFRMSKELFNRLNEK